MQTLARLGLLNSAVAISRGRGVPSNRPIENMQTLLNIKIGRLGKPTQTGARDDSRSDLNSGVQRKTLIGKPARKKFSLIQSRLKSPSCSNLIRICIGSRWPIK